MAMREIRVEDDGDIMDMAVVVAVLLSSMQKRSSDDSRRTDNTLIWIEFLAILYSAKASSSSSFCTSIDSLIYGTDTTYI